MKNYKPWIAIFLAFVILFGSVFYLDNKSYADALTVAMVAGGTIAVMSAIGMSLYGSNNMDGQGLDSFISGQIYDYIGNRSISDVFGSEVIRAVAGKLVIPAVLYNNIIDFIDYFTIQNNISTIPNSFKNLAVGSYYGIPVQFTQYGYDVSNGRTWAQFFTYKFNWAWNGVGVSVDYGEVISNRQSVVVNLMNNGIQISSANANWYIPNNPSGEWCLTTRSENPTKCSLCFVEYAQSSGRYFEHASAENIELTSTGKVNIRTDNDYEEPSSIDVGYQWEGDLGAAPDTNLEDLLEEIFNNAAVDDLQVDGEIVEPAPAPTPVPTFEPYPPVDDILPGINTGIEIGNDLIVGQQTQTGAITQGLEGVQEAVESVEGTIEALSETPDSEDLPEFKFDLRELFPFCIPFDIYRLLSSFDAEPEAPHVQLPIVIDSINFQYNLDLDFSAWNPVAQAMRTAELIVYAIALAWATGKVIKW